MLFCLSPSCSLSKAGELLHATMRSPFGKIEMARKNILKLDKQKIIYVIKDLENLPSIIESEDYFQRTISQNENFKSSWINVKFAIKSFIDEIRQHNAGSKMTALTAGSIERFTSEKGLECVRQKAETCIMGIKNVWQEIWEMQQQIQKMIKNIGKI